MFPGKGEYIPIVLLGILFITDDNLAYKLNHMIWNAFFTICILVLFLVLVDKLECDRHSVLFGCMFLWILLIYVKRCNSSKTKGDK